MSDIPVRKQIAKIIYGVVLIIAISLASWQIYQVSVGKVPSAIPIQSLPEKQRVPGKSLPELVKIKYTPMVKKILANQPVNVKELGGTAERVVFRNPGGELLCTIAKNLDKNIPKLLPLSVDRQGKVAKGPGVICGSIDVHKPSKYDAKCQEGKIRRFGIGQWNNQVSLGVCLKKKWPPLPQDAINNQTDVYVGERLKNNVLDVGQYTKLGKYACAMEGVKVVCANLETGKGFEFGSLLFGDRIF